MPAFARAAGLPREARPGAAKRPAMTKMIIIRCLIVCALVASSSLIASAAAAVPAPKETRPPGLTSGKLANRSFLVSTSQGSGFARYFGNGSLDGSATATRAIIIVHGVLRNADTYFATGELILKAAYATRTLL